MARWAQYYGSKQPYPVFLPVWRRAIFVDWHGVLCHDRFWFSILSDSNHPYHDRMCRATEDLFTARPEMVEAWMRGELTSEEVVESLEVCLDRRCKSDFLARRLRHDCRRMRAQPELLHELQAARRASFVMLATDNMDCFAERLRVGKDLGRAIDGVLSSATLGVLKSDSVLEFFGPWLDAHSLGFSDTVLLDDNERICEAFRAAGGSAIYVASSEAAIQGLRHWQQALEPRRPDV